MKRRWHQKLYGAVGVPFILSQWMPFALEFKGSPKVAVEGTQLHISTEEAAGGFAYFLQMPIPLKDDSLNFSWSWNIPRFPATKYSTPLKKENEDFALRVGLLVSDGRSRIPIPGKFKREIRKRGFNLSYVLFYCATPPNSSQSCAPSPFHGKVINCLKPASSKRTSITVNPLQDLRKSIKLSKRDAEKLQIFGVWLFADSDNSNSKSEAYIADIRFMDGIKGVGKRGKE